jgi:hypothetical protein
MYPMLPVSLDCPFLIASSFICDKKNQIQFPMGYVKNMFNAYQKLLEVNLPLISSSN